MNFVHCHLDFHHHNIFIFTLISKSMKLVLPRNATVPYVTIILVITNEIASIPILKCSLSYASISAANNIITSTSSSLTTIAINAAELLTGVYLVKFLLPTKTLPLLECWKQHCFFMIIDISSIAKMMRMLK
jgi:hypothetical protein